MPNKNPELEAYKRMVRKRLEGLVPIFSKAAEGDFSQEIDVPEDPEEFAELYEKTQLILDTVRTKSLQIKDLNAALEQKIKERTRELEEQIEFSETLLQAISDMGEGMAIVDPASDKFIYANKALSKILGYSKKEILAFDSILDITPQDELEHLKDRQHKRSGGEEIPSHYETVVLNKKGQRINLEISVKEIKGEGNGLKLIGVVRDITDKKKTDTELIAAHEELERRVEMRTAELAEAVSETKKVLASITDAYLRLDKEGKIIDLNPRAEKMLGKTKDRLHARSFWASFPEIKQSYFYKNWKQINLGQSPITFEEYWSPIKRWVAVHAYPNPLGGGSIYLRDIHARKLAEQKVQDQLTQISQERAKDEALLGNIGEGVVAVDKNLKVAFTNPTAVELFGFEGKELVGQDLDKTFVLVDDRGRKAFHRRCILAQALSTQTKVHSNKYFIQKQDKSLVPVSLTATPIFFNGTVTGAIGVYRDIGKEREIDRAKSEFVALAAHQLRTPMTITSWYSEKLLHEKDVKKRSRFIIELNTANRRMINLVNALLDASRLELGTLGSNPEKFDLQNLIQDILTMLKNEIQEKELRVFFDFDSAMKTISADKKLIRVIIENLISNAVKYTSAEGKVRVRVKKDDQNLHVEVSDTGMGIPEKQQQQVFQKLFRADNAQQTASDGTGLGLYITKSIVEQFGGSINFISKEGEGSTFMVDIPLKEISRRSVKDTGK
ncbi:MAG: PAS domain S-box protein [Candidatus Harrisonbacteria bacterium]|nr:PAS domain S-box protein [Candidatus Harrisonbacteria bacterium]